LRKSKKYLKRSKFITKDSGKREKFKTGAQRDTEDNKGRYDLIPEYPLLRLAQLYERGAQKYTSHNWRKSMPFSRCMSSLIRHAFQFKQGLKDEDHLAAVVFNAFCIMQYEKDIKDGKISKEIDDLYKS